MHLPLADEEEEGEEEEEEELTPEFTC